MKFGVEKLTLVQSPLVRFTGDQLLPMGSVLLPITLGDTPTKATRMINFLVVDCPLAYNAIVG